MISLFSIEGSSLILLRGTCVPLLLACLAAPARADSTAVVDPSVQYQTWQGWGTSLAWWAKVVGGYPEPARSDFMDKAFDPIKGLGLNVVRYNIGGGENPEHTGPKGFLSFRAAVPGYESAPGTWDWTADANQRWVLREAMKRGANQVEAFSNSPPWWMTRSGSVTGNQGGGDNLKPESDAAFADYLATVAKHFRDAWGITFRDVEPLNEPSASWWTFGGGNNHQEGCHVDRPHQNDVVKATGAALTRLGLGGVSVSASDESVIGDADRTVGVYDSVALKALNKINTHSYGGGDRTLLWNFANAHGKDLWLSEYGDGDASGLQMSRQILTDVRGLHPTAWVYWQVVDGGGWGLLDGALKDETTAVHTVTKKYYVLAQYSRFIRPGVKLIAVTDPNSLAAYDARSHRVIIVTTNSGDAPTRITYDLSRFTHLGPSAAAYRTSPTEELAKLPPIGLTGKRLAVTVPAKSVTTYLIPGAAYAGPLGWDYRKYVTLINGGGASAGGPGQQWALVGLGAGFTKIVNRDSGLILDVSQASVVAGAAVFPYEDNGGENQQWRLTPAARGTFKIVNRHSGLLLGTESGTSGLTQQADDGRASQSWRIAPVKGTL